VPYGAPAVERLADRVHAAKQGDALAGVTVVVPSNAAGVAARRALAGRPGGVANVTFLTLHRLAERVGAPALAAAGRRPVSTPVLAAAVRAVLHEDPGVFAPVAEHPATEQALVAATRELATAPDAALDDVAACSPRATDVVRIHREVRRRLADDWFDEQDLLVAAAEVLRSSGGRDLGPVVLHLIQEITAAAAELLRVLGEVTAVEALVGVTGDPDADAPVLAAHQRAGVSVPGDQETEPCCASRIVSTSDPDDEVRAAVRLVTGWMREGTPLGRVALLYGTADPYRRLLHEHLAAAGIAVNGSPVTAVGGQLLGRTLRALLALPDRGYRRRDVLAVLTGAPVLDGDGPVPSRAWERVSRAAGVAGGDDWDLRLATFAAQQRERAEQAQRDEDEALAAHLCRDADRADDLAAFVRRLRAAVDRGCSISTWEGLVGWSRELLRSYLGPEHRRADWPDHEQRAAERVEEALDRLERLDALGGPAPTVDVFRRTLERELESSLRRVGRLGEGVLVGHVSLATGLVLDRVAVLGLAEGTFPPRRLEDSLLPDAEREAARGELPLRVDRLQDDRRHLLAAVAAAGEAVLCASRGDLRRAGERPASRWLLGDAARLAGVDGLRSTDLARLPEADWLDHVPSFAGGLAALDTLATEQELRLAAVARDAAADPVLDDPLLKAAGEVVRARRSNDFTRFDGDLSDVAGPELLERRSSATRLQAWATCPHAYLVRYVLRVEPVEEREHRIEIDALSRGALVHDILDRFVTDAIASGHPLDRWGPDDERRLLDIAGDCFRSYEAMGLTGRDLLWRRDRQQIAADLLRLLHDDSARLAGGTRPVSTEHEFTDLAMAGITVGGQIDRIDRRPDGSLVVLDYKTGSSRSYAELSDDDPHVGGTRLQPYLYARAAARDFPTDQPVWAGYWFVSAKGKFEQKGYAVTPEVAGRVEAALDVIVSGIGNGLFPAKPSAQPPWGYVDCDYCRPDGLSGADRRRQWEAKRHDPRLRPYFALAEPEDFDDGN
jgi:ATP-dependent helicase/nuclease subunit B